MPRQAIQVKIFLLALLIAGLAFGQRDLATLVGTVTDASGSALPNAKVTIIEDATGQRYEVTTNENGDYIRPALKPGTYSVEAEVAGFKKGIQHGFALTAGDRTAINIQLSVGDMTQSVEISAEAPLLQTESTILGQDCSETG